jgi:hypothetical protein
MVNTSRVGDWIESLARPGTSEPPGACLSRDSHINESAVFSG